MTAGGGKDVVWRFISRISFIKCTVIILNSWKWVISTRRFQMLIFRIWIDIDNVDSSWTNNTCHHSCISFLWFLLPFGLCFLSENNFRQSQNKFMRFMQQNSWLNFTHRVSWFVLHKALSIWQNLPFRYQSKDWTAN